MVEIETGLFCALAKGPEGWVQSRDLGSFLLFSALGLVTAATTTTATDAATTNMPSGSSISGSRSSRSIIAVAMAAVLLSHGEIFIFSRRQTMMCSVQ